MFKTILFIAGVALVSASDCKNGNCDSDVLVEHDASAQLAERCTRVNPALCHRCRGAATKRARRWRQIVAWRNNYQRGIARWYAAYMKKRAQQLKYWGTHYYAWIRKQYAVKLAYKNRIVASWVKTMNWRYNNCK